MHDNLTRQITESVYIFRTEQQTEYELMNTKSEWNAPTLYVYSKERNWAWLRIYWCKNHEHFFNPQMR